ncbi:unnamed protein product [Fusarium fujikuroi]|uniref:Uncharacterized protein n=1 Tax=Fusarium fujikuroi TaxID=5127 RepID=A0A9Q9RM23_FUSFU|nr:unnamed protein product [Fusarium fujikuroi]VTT82602.1 unnamed protein product [Fusarium fujikuroi]VZH87286.1 unnamed protein product [Fusarium fujikuroi]
MGYTHDIELMSVMTDFEIIGFRHQVQFPASDASKQGSRVKGTRKVKRLDGASTSRWLSVEA